MINLVCRTNLDLANERWPKKLPAVPAVGDLIRSCVKHDGFQLMLEVVRVRWKDNYHDDPERPAHSYTYWYPEIELGIPKEAYGSTTEFYEWYAPKVGRSVSDFI